MNRFHQHFLGLAPFDALPPLGVFLEGDDAAGGGGDERRDDPGSDAGGGGFSADDAAGEEPPEADGFDWKAEAAKYKTLMKKAEGHAKYNAEAAKKLAEIEESSKTEAQKTADRLLAAQTEAQSSKSELLRLRVAMRKGLTEAQAKRLVGDTEEDLEADADDLLASFGGAKKSEMDKETTDDATGDMSGRRPKEKLRGGALSDDDGQPAETDPAKLAALIPREF